MQNDRRVLRGLQAHPQVEFCLRDGLANLMFTQAGTVVAFRCAKSRPGPRLGLDLGPGPDPSWRQNWRVSQRLSERLLYSMTVFGLTLRFLWHACSNSAIVRWLQSGGGRFEVRWPVARMISPRGRTGVRRRGETRIMRTRGVEKLRKLDMPDMKSWSSQVRMVWEIGGAVVARVCGGK